MAQIFASAAPISTRNTNVEDTRKSITYHPSVWGNHFLSYTTNVTLITAAEKEQLATQKEKVKKLLAQTPDDSTLKIELIDAIQRLGVGYHFEKEIDESLRQIHDDQAQISKDKGDLRVVALRFRLLRQQGYRVPCDVFNEFIDEGGNFKEWLKDDVEGMVSLYEASYYGIKGEEILDKALQFASPHLKSLLHQITTTSCVSRRVKDAFEMPISRALIRLGVKKFMYNYQEDESHNQDLLHFGKLDFNIVQKMHQKELYHITRWWEDLRFANRLPFARDRVVEGYFWTVGVYHEPHYDTARKYLTKILAMISIVDDIYDVHGALHDLRRFTHAFPSWDITAFDELPEYMKTYYEALLGVYAEMEDEMGKHGLSYRLQYSKQEMVKLSKAYMEEAEWCYSNHIPTLDDYIKLALVSSSHLALATTSLVGMRHHVSKHDFDWITNEPPILRTSAILGRLADDLAGRGEEKKITAIECCMNEKGWSRMEGVAEISRLVNEAWKDMNDEWLEPRLASTPILSSIMNLTRVLFTMYADGDAYTHSTTRTKDYIKDVFVDPVQY